MAALSSSTQRFVRTFLANKLVRRGFPYFGSLEVTRRCNSRCSFCPIGNEKVEISQIERKRMLDQICTELLSRASTYGFTLSEVIGALREREESPGE